MDIFKKWLPDKEKRQESARKWLSRAGALALVALHLGGSYQALRSLTPNAPLPSLLQGSPFSQTFFAELFMQLLLVGAFLYAILIAFWSFGHGPTNVLRPVAGIFALSSAMALLLAADASLHPRPAGGTPSNLWSLIYTLVTQRQALLALSLIVATGIGVITYRLLRSIFSVEYTGSGVQIRLPGQTVYYLPIYPQVCWQDTGIQLQKGEKVNVELSGLVSPGAMHLKVLDAWTKHMNAFVSWQCKYINGESTLADLEGIKPPATWPYTGPEGYPAEWYTGEKKIEILKGHDLYKKDSFYREDSLLTVKGLPHNTVVGFIQPFGEGKPQDTEKGEPAYDWADAKDKEKLLLLSASQYPLADQEIPRSGRLWVVINDVDLARWDNAGMFFLKLTRRAWI